MTVRSASKSQIQPPNGYQKYFVHTYPSRYTVISTSKSRIQSPIGYQNHKVNHNTNKEAHLTVKHGGLPQPKSGTSHWRTREVTREDKEKEHWRSKEEQLPEKSKYRKQLVGNKDRRQSGRRSRPRLSIPRFGLP